MSGLEPAGFGLGLPSKSVVGAPSLVPVPIQDEYSEIWKSPFSGSINRGSWEKLLEFEAA